MDRHRPKQGRQQKSDAARTDIGRNRAVSKKVTQHGQTGTGGRGGEPALATTILTLVASLCSGVAILTLLASLCASLSGVDILALELAFFWATVLAAVLGLVSLEDIWLYWMFNFFLKRLIL